jgi:hypothetical protein
MQRCFGRLQFEMPNPRCCPSAPRAAAGTPAPHRAPLSPGPPACSHTTARSALEGTGRALEDQFEKRLALQEQQEAVRAVEALPDYGDEEEDAPAAAAAARVGSGKGAGAKPPSAGAKPKAAVKK